MGIAESGSCIVWGKSHGAHENMRGARRRDLTLISYSNLMYSENISYCFCSTF